MGGWWSIKTVLPAIAPDLDHALRRYCALDTLAMVRLVRFFENR